jgi:hypothetical protein
MKTILFVFLLFVSLSFAEDASTKPPVADKDKVIQIKDLQLANASNVIEMQRMAKDYRDKQEENVRLVDQINKVLEEIQTSVDPKKEKWVLNSQTLKFDPVKHDAPKKDK